MKKLVMLGIGVFSILSGSVLAEGSSFFYALSNFASGQQVSPPAVRDSSLAAIEGGFVVPFVSFPFLPDIDFSDLPDDCDNCNVVVVRSTSVCRDGSCDPQDTNVMINQIIDQTIGR